MPHTPRLCIDSRAAWQFPTNGTIAAELIDQLVSSVGEGAGPGEWIEKQRTVILGHPSQVFAGQMKRFSTSRKIGSGPLSRFWESQFLKKAELSAYHRFRPLDKLSPTGKCPTINTLLPPEHSLPRRVNKGENQRYVVPSRADSLLLQSKYSIPENQISVLTPSPRRFVYFNPPEGRAYGGGKVLCLGGPSRERILPLLKERYPSLVFSLVSDRDPRQVSPLQWRKLVGDADLCLYFEARPFDWATLALEAIYWGVPVISSEKNTTLAEYLGESVYVISRLLLELPKVAALKEWGIKQRGALQRSQVFAPFGQATQYAEIYETLKPTVD